MTAMAFEDRFWKVLLTPFTGEQGYFKAELDDSTNLSQGRVGLVRPTVTYHKVVAKPSPEEDHETLQRFPGGVFS